SLLGVVLIILELIFDLIAVDTACGVDLVDSDLRAVLYCDTVNSSASCARSHSADLKCSAVRCLSAFCVACSLSCISSCFCVACSLSCISSCFCVACACCCRRFF